MRLLKKMGSCYKELQQPEKALALYKRQLQLAW